MQQLFNITYTVPYEGDCTLYDYTTQEVLRWIEDNYMNGYGEYARIVPVGQEWYDTWDFVHTFGKE